MAQNAYAWDRANRLLSMGGASYAYDGSGNRVQQTVSSLVTRYLLDTQPGLAVVLKATTGSDDTYFIHGPRGLERQHQPSGDWVFPVPDGLGSIRGVVDNNWPELAMLESRLYAPYGVPFGVQGTQQTVYGFTGEPTDANELVYLRSRYLNPELGMFVSLDPMDGAIRRANSLNRYGYAESNPIMLVDPSGSSIFCGTPLESEESDEPCISAEALRLLRWFLIRDESRSPSPNVQRLEVLRRVKPWELKLLAINGLYEGAGYNPASVQGTTHIWLNRLISPNFPDTIGEVLAPPYDPTGITASAGWPLAAPVSYGIANPSNPDPKVVEEAFRSRALTNKSYCHALDDVIEVYRGYGIHRTNFLGLVYFKHCSSRNRMELERCNCLHTADCHARMELVEEADNLFLSDVSVCVYPIAQRLKCQGLVSDWQHSVEEEYCGCEWKDFVKRYRGKPGWPNWGELESEILQEQAADPRGACGIMTRGCEDNL